MSAKKPYYLCSNLNFNNKFRKYIRLEKDILILRTVGKRYDKLFVKKGLGDYGGSFENYQQSVKIRKNLQKI